MGCRGFKILSVILKTSLIFSCGVKGPPKPIPPPEYELRRIGTKVFLIPKTQGLRAEGFVSEGDLLVREDPSRFCFTVYSPGTRRVMACVEEAKGVEPNFRLELREDRVEVLLDEEGRYRVYPYIGGRLHPKVLKEVEGRKIELERGREEKVFAITKVLGKVESEPVLVRVPTLEPPRPKPPREVRYLVKGGRIYLYWWSEEDEAGFLVYRNGKLLTPRPIKRNYFVDDLPVEGAVYEIVSVNEAGGRSEPARIVYRP